MLMDSLLRDAFLVSLTAITAGPILAALLRSRLGALALSLAGLMGVASMALYVASSGITVIMFRYLEAYPLSAFFLMLVSVVMALVELLAYRYSKFYHEVAIFMGFAFAGAFLVAAAASLLPIFIGLELLALSTALMILLEGRRRTEAAVKIFIVSSIAIALFSFALALVFNYDPNLALALSAAPAGAFSEYVLLLSMGLFIAALGFEGALFPFNLWIPDVYQGAPAYITAMMAGVNKKIAFLAIIEIVVAVFYSYSSVYSQVFFVLSILTMFFGNLLALTQRNVKRMFAYSSISQAGYILIGLAAGTGYGLAASLFYIFAHAFMITGAFAIVLMLETMGISSVEEYTGLYGRNRFVAVALGILMLSMAGIPPFIGFFGKFLLFSSALYAHMALLALLGVINSFISIYYYARVMNAMFAAKRGRAIAQEPVVYLVVLAALAVVVFFGVYPQPLMRISSIAAGSIKSAFVLFH